LDWQKGLQRSGIYTVISFRCQARILSEKGDFFFSLKKKITQFSLLIPLLVDSVFICIVSNALGYCPDKN